MPDQPELRQRVTRVLRDHSETLDKKYRYGCVCGEWTGANLAEHWGHVADVLLALPGIAIVQTMQHTGINGTDNRAWSHLNGLYMEQEFNGDVIFNDRFAIEADNLRPVAAALLAAATGVAEEQTNA